MNTEGRHENVALVHIRSDKGFKRSWSYRKDFMKLVEVCDNE